MLLSRNQELTIGSTAGTSAIEAEGEALNSRMCEKEVLTERRFSLP